MNRFFIILSLVFFSLNISAPCYAQQFLAGADLSYTNSILENGGIYRDTQGNEVDPYLLFAQKGAKMIRIRLWHTPENITDHCGSPITANNLDDVVLAFQRAKTQGMLLNLAIHYGDYFNDPGCQKMPAAWEGLSQSILLDSIYQYTIEVLDVLRAEDVVPDIVAIGNETTWGFVDETPTTNGWSWPQDAEKFNAALDAVDHFNNAHSATIKKALHFTDETAEWLAGLFEDQGITNFDIIGLSYYPAWTEKTLQELGIMVAGLKSSYNKEIMILETGAAWTTGNSDGYTNFMNGYGVLDYEISPQGQKSFLMDLANMVYVNGGAGILYWEPGWISSEMCDLWGQGSSYENVSFFDFNNNNAALPAFDFFSYCNTFSVGSELNSIELSAFPNPGKGTFTMLGLESDTEIRVSDSLGKLVKISRTDGGVLLLNDLPNGAYFLTFRVKDTVRTRIVLKY